MTCNNSFVFEQIRKANTKATPHPAESFLSGASAVYLEQAYLDWKQNPDAVHSVCLSRQNALSSLSIATLKCNELF